jgi:hypothetical protein
MFGVTTSDDYRPVTWMGRYPVRITSIVAALFVLGMFATAIATSANWSLAPFIFTVPAFLHGSIWQPLTCVLIQGPDFFFLFNVFFFYWAGTEVEKYLGIRRYLWLLAILVLVGPIVLSAWAIGGVYWTYLGSIELSIGMFIAFATLYPNVELFGWVTLKWLAFAGLVLGSMQRLPGHSWGSLSILWAMCLAAFLCIRFAQERIPIQINFERFRLFRRRRPKLVVLQKPTASYSTEADEIAASVDPILEKISKSGIGSLTASERRQLDRARNRLLHEGE